MIIIILLIILIRTIILFLSQKIKQWQLNKNTIQKFKKQKSTL